jgi:3-hydroxyacyl-[acyl-carrier-protein] dehydratase
MRWTWIDRFTEFTSGKRAVAVKALAHAEDHFADHFPGVPVMPAALILEGLAQTGGILLGEANQFREKVVLAKIPHAKFEREAVPGEMLTYTAELLDLRPEGGIVRGRVVGDYGPVCEAEIFFAHVDAARSQAIFGDGNFVFDSGLKGLLAGLPASSARTATTSRVSGAASSLGNPPLDL